MARGTWRRSDADGHSAGPEQRMVPHDQRPRHLDAGQVGVSVVCRLGPGFSRHCAFDSRCRFRQGPARSDARVRSTSIPSGQIPAYEWNFSDVNPPVHAWATIFLHRTEEALRGKGDIAFLKRAFGKLMLNFNWWVNRKDRFGKNVFEGGFLGLDNIGVFDRSAPLPTGGYLEQADGTAWMALFCQNMLEIGVELAVHDPDYDDLAAKFGDHFLWIAHAMNRTRTGWHVGRRGWVLLRRPAPPRWKRYAAQGPLHGGPAAFLCHHRRRALATGTGPYTIGALRRLRRMPHLRQDIHPTGPGHFGVADAASSPWCARTDCAGSFPACSTRANF